MNFASWTGATECTDGPESGAKALLAYLLQEYPQASSLGIYNCRTVRGGSTTSTHGEGRAVDLKWPMSSAGRGVASGEAVAKRLGTHGKRLGIQAIIYNRRIYSEVSPDGRYYGGTTPHYDHLHIELTRASGRNLTLATLQSVLGSTTFKLGDRLLRLTEPMTRGQDVLKWQTTLADRGTDIAIDGIFGPNTEAATEALQKVLNITVDGIVGPETIRAATTEPEPLPGPFTDVPIEHVNVDNIARAKELGLLVGYSDGSLKPEASLTRSQAATLAVRLVDLLA